MNLQTGPARYKVLKSTSQEDLEKTVTHCLNVGWRAQGGLVVIMVDGTVLFAQAVVKE